MEALQRASAILFYTVGTVTLILIMLARRGMAAAFSERMLSIVDLPLLLVGMLYGGLSLYGSLTRGKSSPMLAAGIFIPLGALFLFFCWLNFVYPFPEMG